MLKVECFLIPSVFALRTYPALPRICHKRQKTFPPERAIVERRQNSQSNIIPKNMTVTLSPNVVAFASCDSKPAVRSDLGGTIMIISKTFTAQVHCLIPT
jgi:hypothetical protein